MLGGKRLAAVKYDKGLDKAPWSLLPFDAVNGMLRVLLYGRRKYTICLNCLTEGKPTKVYSNPRLDGDPNRDDCPQCSSVKLDDGAHNWRKGFKWSRLIDSGYRHFMSVATGESTDKESGELHIHHLMCCVAFLAEHITKNLGENDIYVYDKNVDD